MDNSFHSEIVAREVIQAAGQVECLGARPPNSVIFSTERLSELIPHLEILRSYLSNHVGLYVTLLSAKDRKGESILLAKDSTGSTLLEYLAGLLQSSECNTPEWRFILTEALKLLVDDIQFRQAYNDCLRSAMLRVFYRSEPLEFIRVVMRAARHEECVLSAFIAEYTCKPLKSRIPFCFELLQRKMKGNVPFSLGSVESALEKFSGHPYMLVPYIGSEHFFSARVPNQQIHYARWYYGSGQISDDDICERVYELKQRIMSVSKDAKSILQELSSKVPAVAVIDISRIECVYKPYAKLGGIHAVVIEEVVSKGNEEHWLVVSDPRDSSIKAGFNRGELVNSDAVHFPQGNAISYIIKASLFARGLQAILCRGQAFGPDPTIDPTHVLYMRP